MVIIPIRLSTDRKSS